MLRTRISLIVALALALIAPAAAPAALTTLPENAPEAAPSCPENCNVLGLTTGYQAKVGEQRGLMNVPRDGTLVSWSVQVGNPGPSQIKFFEQQLTPEPPQAGIVVLRPGTKLRARVAAQAPVKNLTPYFGKTVEFALTETIKVKKGWTIALTVPTWAPVLAVGLPVDTSWRASRMRGSCDDTKTPTMAAINTTPQFYCLYRGARILYSARIITTT